ncbi:bifunctional 5,10-methylenetetrahydrofolate dehydrogenase/5,10-methenyltetrahydrofolate cyclohydrolase [Syntrophomonas erecta]
MVKASILYGKPLVDKVLNEVAEGVKALNEKNISPLLMTVEVGDDPASKVYHQSQRRTAELVGINYESVQLSGATSQQRLMNILRGLNRDPYIHGMILHVPLPAHIDARVVQWGMESKKDVEGVTPHNLGRLFLGVPGLIPCTAQAIVAMIKSTGVDLRGKEVTIVGQSDIVGKPTAIMLLKEEATVTVCHYATTERGHLEKHIRGAEILVVAAGQPELIKGDWIREGAIVIDAGINAIEDKIVGDVEFDGALEKASFITPVPGGVGALTVAYLMKNTIDAVRWQIEED